MAHRENEPRLTVDRTNVIPEARVFQHAEELSVPKGTRIGVMETRIIDSVFSVVGSAGGSSATFVVLPTARCVAVLSLQANNADCLE